MSFDPSFSIATPENTLSSVYMLGSNVIGNNISGTGGASILYSSTSGASWNNCTVEGTSNLVTCFYVSFFMEGTKALA